MLEEHEVVMYFDSSVRLLPCFLDYLPQIKQGLQTAGVQLLHRGTHYALAATNPGLYQYIPTDQDKLYHTRNFDAGVAIVSRKRDFIENVMYWHLLCAFNEGCLTPEGHQLHCDGIFSHRHNYSGCHRYDQSSLNTLLANNFDYDVSRYTTETNSCLKVVRGRKKNAKPKICV